MRVVVDVHAGKALHALDQEVHEPLERDALRRRGRAPRVGLNCGLVAVDEAQAEQVFEAVLLERIALHVEEHVAGIGLRHAIEAAPALSVEFEKLDARLARRAPRELQRRLRA